MKNYGKAFVCVSSLGDDYPRSVQCIGMTADWKLSGDGFKKEPNQKLCDGAMLDIIPHISCSYIRQWSSPYM